MLTIVVGSRISTVCLLAVLLGALVPTLCRAQGRSAKVVSEESTGEAKTQATSTHPSLQEDDTSLKGDRNHYSWMDSMQQQQVRRAVVRTVFVWRGKPEDVTVSKIVYFSKYEHDCAQIDDPKRLSQFQASGLEKQLSDAAIAHTKRANWISMDKIHKPKRGVAIIELLDSESLPLRPDILVPALPASSPFRIAVDMDDVYGTTAILKEGVSSTERDQGLWATLVVDDSCMTGAILKFGANPNLTDASGLTVLMTAVRYQALANVMLLVKAGANVNAKADNGQTALSLAKGAGNQELIHFLEKSGARE